MAQELKAFTVDSLTGTNTKTRDVATWPGQARHKSTRDEIGCDSDDRDRRRGSLEGANEGTGGRDDDIWLELSNFPGQLGVACRAPLAHPPFDDEVMALDVADAA